MAFQRYATPLFVVSCLGALILLVGGQIFGPNIGSLPPDRVPATTWRSPGSEEATADASAIPSPFSVDALPDEDEEDDDAVVELSLDEDASDEEVEIGPAEEVETDIPTVYRGATRFDPLTDTFIVQRDVAGTDEVRFGARDIRRVESRPDGEQVIILREGPPVLVTDELLAAAPETVRSRISYERPTGVAELDSPPRPTGSE